MITLETRRGYQGITVPEQNGKRIGQAVENSSVASDYAFIAARTGQTLHVFCNESMV